MYELARTISDVKMLLAPPRAASGRYTDHFRRSGVRLRSSAWVSLIAFCGTKVFTILYADFEAGFMFTPEELRQAKIFACLDEAECARLAHTIADVRLEPGEWLFRGARPLGSMCCWKAVCG
jgi:hypothetical protein